MNEFIAKLTSLLWYVPYIWEEKKKVQLFINNFSFYMKEWLEFDNPKTMDDVVRKVWIYCQQMKIKIRPGKLRRDKKCIKG